MLNFEYDASLGKDIPAYHDWNGLTGTSTYFVGSAAARKARESVFDLNGINPYTERDYPGNEGLGVHAVAKYVEHEYWHGKLRLERRPTWLPGNGQGHLDSDDDILCDDREAEIGTDITKKDTCGITSYTETDYSGYADYADNELFCRWKQNGVLGIVSKDWAADGAQSPEFTDD